MDQPVWNCMDPEESMARLVPPTAVSHGLTPDTQEQVSTGGFEGVTVIA